MTAARAAQEANRARVTADEATGVEELRRRGMTVITTVNTAAFQEAHGIDIAAQGCKPDGKEPAVAVQAVHGKAGSVPAAP